MPSWDEARLLAEVRLEVAETVAIEIGFTDAASVMQRYEELMERREDKRNARRSLAVV